VREHLLRFFDAVDKLSVMDVQINEDLLSIMLLYSLPASYENFRCAIESHDKLPSAEALKVKIIEESEARVQKSQNATDAMAAWKGRKGKKYTTKKKNSDKSEHNRKESGFRKTIWCYKCQAIGHKANNCVKKNEEREEKATTVDDAFHISLESQDATLYSNTKHGKVGWCLDSGCTSHICRDEDLFVDQIKQSDGRLNLASNDSTSITGKGNVNMLVDDGKKKRSIMLKNTILAPDIRMNLVSVSKITDHDHEVIFRKDRAIIQNNRGEVKMVADRIGNLYFVREGKPTASITCEKTNQNFILWHQ